MVDVLFEFWFGFMIFVVVLDVEWWIGELDGFVGFDYDIIWGIELFVVEMID